MFWHGWADHTVKIWDPATHQQRWGWTMPGCTSCAWAPDSRHLAVTSTKGTIYILRLGGP